MKEYKEALARLRMCGTEYSGLARERFDEDIAAMENLIKVAEDLAIENLKLKLQERILTKRNMGRLERIEELEKQGSDNYRAYIIERDENEMLRSQLAQMKAMCDKLQDDILIKGGRLFEQEIEIAQAKQDERNSDI